MWIQIQFPLGTELNPVIPTASHCAAATQNLNNLAQPTSICTIRVIFTICVFLYSIS